MKLFVPLILGTAREGRRSEHAAEFVLEEIRKRDDMEAELLDVRHFRLPATDNTEQDALEKKFSGRIARSDALVIVTPEYNHGYPGELKMMLDMAYKEYARKPMAICGTGGGLGGGRMTEQLRLVAIELGMAPIREAVYFSDIWNLFDEKGAIKDPAYEGRVKAMLDELSWYAVALKRARAETRSS